MLVFIIIFKAEWEDWDSEWSIGHIPPSKGVNIKRGVERGGFAERGVECQERRSVEGGGTSGQ